MSMRWVAVAAVNGFLAVSAGAFGAHYLQSHLDAKAMNAFEVGVRYQMYHALALLAVAWLMSLRASRLASASAVCMLLGIVLFTGSLYVTCLFEWKWLGPVTPVGGALLMAGWLLLAIAALRGGAASATSAWWRPKNGFKKGSTWHKASTNKSCGM